MIADDLLRLAHRRPDSDRAACVLPAKTFKRLAEVRNGILHGKPGTAEGGEQRLFRDGAVWNIGALLDVADDFADCSQLLNALLYDQLSAP